MIVTAAFWGKEERELLPPCLGLGLIWSLGDVDDSGKGNGKELTLFSLAVA